MHLISFEILREGIRLGFPMESFPEICVRVLELDFVLRDHAARCSVPVRINILRYGYTPMD